MNYEELITKEYVKETALKVLNGEISGEVKSKELFVAVCLNKVEIYLDFTEKNKVILVEFMVNQLFKYREIIFTIKAEAEIANYYKNIQNTFVFNQITSSFVELLELLEENKSKVKDLNYEY